MSDDTTRLSNGSHTYTAKAYDAAGNSSSSSSTVTVNNTTTPPGQLQWVVTPASSQADYGYATATDASGNVFVAGKWSIGPSVFLAKYSPSGVQLWWKTFTASGSAYGIALDANGNVFITGEYFGTANFGGSSFTGSSMTSSMFVAKFSAAGAHLWSRGFPRVSGPNLGRSVKVDRNGNIVLTGRAASIDFGGGVMTGSGGGSLFVANLSGADGSYLWAKLFGTGYASGNGIAVDGSGNLFVTGYFQSTINFDSVQLTSGNYGGFVVKLSASGAHLWSKGFGTFVNDPASYGCGGNSISIAPNGDALITGAFVGTIDLGGGALTANSSSVFDIFFARFSNTGTCLWSKHVTSSSATTGIGYGAASDGSGNMLFTGLLYGTADFGGATTSTTGASTFVAKYSSAGNCLWAKAYGGNNLGSGIAADALGNVLVTGNWSGTANFGGGLLSSQGGSNDSFLLNLTP
jgi:hypothetical protein